MTKDVDLFVNNAASISDALHTANNVATDQVSTNMNTKIVDVDSDNNANNGEQGANLSASQVNLEIKCEVGQVTMSLAQLMALKVGDVVEFVRWPNKVKLSVNGVYIAHGMLVEVEGMLGVKITDRINVV